MDGAQDEVDNFNSIKVRLELLNRLLSCMTLSYFNSIKVRLEQKDGYV